VADLTPSPLVQQAQQLAERFTRHLLHGEFAAANALLTPACAKALPVASLADQWTSMSAADDPFTELGIDAELGNWPDKTKRQVRWIYVGVFGKQHVEAVIVTVERATRRGALAIDTVEFGRP
jgi:hypothetical protein